MNQLVNMEHFSITLSDALASLKDNCIKETFETPKVSVSGVTFSVNRKGSNHA